MGAVKRKDSDAENRRRKVDRVKWSVVCHFEGCMIVNLLVRLVVVAQRV